MFQFVLLPILIIVLLVIVAVTWIPSENKIKYLMWRGNYDKARKILEPLLAENPERLSLYRHLAEIYYFENRKDKRALRIFDIILRLKIPFQWRNEIYPLVAKYYISEGRTDSEALEIIERAVEKELIRIKM
ncbi:MAG: tetratricopeptide repeat protein [Caldithrix sp.]|nr:MAG: tetratricopeptide repeat protein [Caldithrix sp.]